jgi:uncharacterized repeat protein (TIGR01451 family)
LAAPVNTAVPAISGTTTVGQTLTATSGTWTGNPTPTYTYAWQRCDGAGANCSAIGGATSSTYTLVSADATNTLKVAVTGSNTQGDATATSAATAVIGATLAAPVNTAVPAISGTTTVGQTLTATSGTWTGNPTPTYTYAWQRCDGAGANCSAIGGAISSTYTLVSADATNTLKVAVTGSNTQGDATATSAATAVIGAGAVPAVLQINLQTRGTLVRSGSDFRLVLGVTNLGPGATNGNVTVTATVQAPAITVSAAGDGWSCSITGTLVTCTRADVLPAGQRYSDVSIAVTLPADVPPSVRRIDMTGSASGGDSPASSSVTVEVVDFNPQGLGIQKTASQPVVRPGDNVAFQIDLQNDTNSELSNLQLRDELAQGFNYIVGSAQLVNTGVAGVRVLPAGLASTMAQASGAGVGAVAGVVTTLGITEAAPLSTDLPFRATQLGRVLVFELGTTPRGARYQIRYRTLAGPEVRPGPISTTVVASFDSPIGAVEDVSETESVMTVSPTSFASSQVLVGRVFHDANGNGRFDGGDSGLAGARLFLPTGQSVSTDAFGMYNVPALMSGSTTVTLDPLTVPGYAPTGGVLAERGWSRLLRSPLGSGALLRQNFALVPVHGVTPSAPPNLRTPARSGGAVSQTVPAATVERPGTWREGVLAHRLEIEAEQPELRAGGRERTLVRVRAFSSDGARIASGSVQLQTTAGALLLPDAPRAGESARLVASVDPAARPGPADLSYCVDGSESVYTPMGAPLGSAPVVDGEALFCLQSGEHAGAAYLTAVARDGSGTQAAARVVFLPERLAPFVAAVGELAIGPREAEGTAGAIDDRLVSTGAVFLQTPVASRGVLTVAVTSAPSINAAMGVDRLGGLDPAERVYTVFGDSSTRQEFATSSEKVFARLDMGASSVTFGDLRGDVPQAGHSGLLDIVRPMTGVQVDLSLSENAWLRLQAARPYTSFAREVYPGSVGGSLRLSNLPVVIGSEVITLEVRDRRRPEIVVRRELLARSIDYTLNPFTGAVIFLRPMLHFADGLHVVNIVASYDYLGGGLRQALLVGRGATVLGATGVRVRGMAARQSLGGGSSIVIGGIGADARLPRGGNLHLEVPFVQRAFEGAGDSPDGALRLDLTQPLPFKDGVASLVVSRTGVAYANPYSTLVMPGRMFVDATVQVRPTTRGLFAVEAIEERVESSGSSRRSFGAEWAQAFGDRLRGALRLDARRLQANSERSSATTTTQMVTASAEWQATSRLHASVRREHNLQEEADPTFPDQTLLSGRFALTPSTQVVAMQRWSAAPIEPLGGALPGELGVAMSTRETAVGIESRVTQYTSVTSRYQVEGGINGTDGYAVLGGLTRLPVTGLWSVDGGLERAIHIAGNGQGYTNVTGGVAFTPENWIVTTHYQHRTGGISRRVATAGLAGQVRPGLTALFSYRLADAFGPEQRALVEANAAVALRPLGSDRAGLLFSYTYGNRLSQTQVQGGDPLDRRTRVSADAYFQPMARVELYARASLVRAPSSGGETDTRLLQSRAQLRLTRRVDVAGEFRLVDQGDTTRLGAGEVGFWVSSDLRLGVGHTRAPWHDTNALGLATAPGRGGVYISLSSKLSSLFDLFQPTRMRHEGVRTHADALGR